VLKILDKKVKIIEICKNVYQIEAGKRAIVLPAKNVDSALKKACKFLGLNCNILKVKK
jgi:hypothetical protein